MYNKQDIINDYLALCESLEKDKISRNEYRKYGAYKTSLIEKIFGSWTKFVSEINNVVVVSRNTNKQAIITNAKTLVVTSVIDGQPINHDYFQVLQNYCKLNNAELCILWGKSLKKSTFSKEDYALIQDYLCTEVITPEAETCLIKDFEIPATCKNPLANFEKLTKYSTIITASPKQYMKILPYDVNTSTYRIAWSTGTISYINNYSSINDFLNEEFNTFGAIKLMWSDDLHKYITTNLIYDEMTKTISDVNKVYTTDTVVDTTVDGIVLGDLHLPEENPIYIKASIDLINQCMPISVMLHDWCSFNSINHHESHKYLTKILNQTEDNKTLEVELNLAVKKLYKIIDQCNDYSTFFIVPSNHDNFLMKWLNDGEFVKDKANAVIGCKLFAKIAEGNHPFNGIIKPNSNLCYLWDEEGYVINGIEVGNHGHEGIAGAKASTKSYSKLYAKSITGHTHSPQIFENHYVVGTNSYLKLAYVNKFTNWAFCNAIVHKNGTVQLFFID